MFSSLVFFYSVATFVGGWRVRLPARTLRALRRNLRAHVRAGQLQITVFALGGKAALDPLGKDASHES